MMEIGNMGTGMVTSMACHIISEFESKNIERMINENYNEMKKEVVTPYPNKEVKVLSLSEIPEDYIGFSDDKLCVGREEPKGGKKIIRVDCIRDGICGSHGAWHLKFKENNRGYNYFNKLLVEAKI